MPTASERREMRRIMFTAASGIIAMMAALAAMLTSEAANA